MDTRANKAVVGIRFPNWMVEELDAACTQENSGGVGVHTFTRCSMVRHAVSEYLERRERQVKRSGGAR
jgi:hypothetical protein